MTTTIRLQFAKACGAIIVTASGRVLSQPSDWIMAGWNRTQFSVSCGSVGWIRHFQANLNDLSPGLYGSTMLQSISAKVD